MRSKCNKGLGLEVIDRGKTTGEGSNPLIPEVLKQDENQCSVT